MSRISQHTYCTSKTELVTLYYAGPPECQIFYMPLVQPIATLHSFLESVNPIPIRGADYVKGFASSKNLEGKVVIGWA